MLCEPYLGMPKNVNKGVGGVATLLWSSQLKTTGPIIMLLYSKPTPERMRPRCRFLLLV